MKLKWRVWKKEKCGFKKPKRKIKHWKVSQILKRKLMEWAEHVWRAEALFAS